MLEMGSHCVDLEAAPRGTHSDSGYKAWSSFPTFFDIWEMLLSRWDAITVTACHWTPWRSNHILQLNFNSKAREAVWQFALLHASISLRREIRFPFQASVVFAHFNPVRSHVEGRGSPARAAPLPESSPFACPSTCCCLLSKHDRLPPASNPSPRWC